MAEKICPTHDLTLELVPEGISKKSNKKYNAFYSCPNRECKYTENIPEKQGHFLSMQAEFKRDKGIAYFNSVNAAIELAKVMNWQDMEKGVRDWRDWFYNEWQEFYLKEIVNQED